MLKVGIIGYGTIGAMLAEAINRGDAGDARLVAVHDVFAEPPFPQRDGRPAYTASFEAFLQEQMDVVIEAAAQAVLRRYAARVLESGRDLIAMSVGAFADPILLGEVIKLARRHGRRVFLPSGAIGGLDALAAAALDEMYSVSLTTTKPVQGLKGSRSLIDPDLDLEAITTATCLYEGPAVEAVKHFPKNVNVAAALSLATVGVERTQVRIVADPHATRNTHRIEAEGKFGRMTLELNLEPSPGNPKTSYLAPLSAIRLIRGLTEPVKIGA